MNGVRLFPVASNLNLIQSICHQRVTPYRLTQQSGSGGEPVPRLCDRLAGVSGAGGSREPYGRAGDLPGPSSRPSRVHPPRLVC